MNRREEYSVRVAIYKLLDRLKCMIRTKLIRDMEDVDEYKDWSAMQSLVTLSCCK